MAKRRLPLPHLLSAAKRRKLPLPECQPGLKRLTPSYSSSSGSQPSPSHAAGEDELACVPEPWVDVDMLEPASVLRGADDGEEVEEEEEDEEDPLEEARRSIFWSPDNYARLSIGQLADLEATTRAALAWAGTALLKRISDARRALPVDSPTLMDAPETRHMLRLIDEYLALPPAPTPTLSQAAILLLGETARELTRKRFPALDRVPRFDPVSAGPCRRCGANGYPASTIVCARCVCHCRACRMTEYLEALVAGHKVDALALTTTLEPPADLCHRLREGWRLLEDGPLAGMAGEELDVHFQRVLRLAGAVASDDQLAQRQLYEAASSLVRRLFEEIPLHQAFGMARLLRVALPFDANTLNSLVLPTLMQVFYKHFHETVRQWRGTTAELNHMLDDATSVAGAMPMFVAVIEPYRVKTFPSFSGLPTAVAERGGGSALVK